MLAILLWCPGSVAEALESGAISAEHRLGAIFERGNVQLIGRAEHVAGMLVLYAQILDLEPGTRIKLIELAKPVYGWTAWTK